MEFYSATRSRNNDPGFRGLHRKQQYSSNRISDLSVILRYKIRMVMGQLYERSQRRKRNQIPKMATYLHYLYITIDRFVYPCAGVHREVLICKLANCRFRVYDKK